MNDSQLTYQQAIHRLKNGGQLIVTTKGHAIVSKNGLSRKPTSHLKEVLESCVLVQEWETGTKIYKLS